MASGKGKNSKRNEKLNSYYAGPKRTPCRVASEEDKKVIEAALADFCDRRNCFFDTNWNGLPLFLKFSIGLTSGLRCLKQNRTQALIYDDTASPHLSKYLEEFALRADIPIIKACRLLDSAPRFKLKTLLVISIVKPFSETTSSLYPLSSGKVIKSESFDSLCRLLQESRCGKKGYSEADLIRIPSSGASKAKKEARRSQKAKAKEERK